MPSKCKRSRKRAKQREEATDEESPSAEEPVVCGECGPLSHFTCEKCALRAQLHDLLCSIRAQADVIAGQSRKDRRALESYAEQRGALARSLGDEGLLAIVAEIQL